MAVTGGGGSARKAPAAKAAPPRAKVVAAAKKRITGKANVAHGYAMAAKGGNFQGGQNPKYAKPTMKASAHGYSTVRTNFIANKVPTPAAQRVRPNQGGGVKLNLGMPHLSMPNISLAPKANAATKGIKPRRVTTGGEGIGAGQQSFFDIGKFLNGLGK